MRQNTALKGVIMLNFNFTMSKKMTVLLFHFSVEIFTYIVLDVFNNVITQRNQYFYSILFTLSVTKQEIPFDTPESKKELQCKPLESKTLIHYLIR